jgi:hypothetical protein
MRAQIYVEYGYNYDNCQGPKRGVPYESCEVDHLIPLELGGSNDIKNLWPQPGDPRPGWDEKDQLENELHAEVCAGKMPLAAAQQCIASNWVECWEETRSTRVRSGVGLRKPPRMVSSLSLSSRGTDGSYKAVLIRTDALRGCRIAAGRL